MTRHFMTDAKVLSGAWGAVLSAIKHWEINLKVEVECVCGGIRTGSGRGGGQGVAVEVVSAQEMAVAGPSPDFGFSEVVMTGA